MIQILIDWMLKGQRHSLLFQRLKLISCHLKQDRDMIKLTQLMMIGMNRIRVISKWLWDSFKTHKHQQNNKGNNMMIDILHNSKNIKQVFRKLDNLLSIISSAINSVLIVSKLIMLIKVVYLLNLLFLTPIKIVYIEITIRTTQGHWEEMNSGIYKQDKQMAMINLETNSILNLINLTVINLHNLEILMLPIDMESLSTSHLPLHELNLSTLNIEVDTNRNLTKV